MANHVIHILMGDLQYNVTTDQSGGFSIEAKNQFSEEIKVFMDKKQLKIDQTYPLFFKNSEYPIVVVSDIDDTILVSYTLSAWKRIKTILFTKPEKRKIISFTEEILNYLYIKKVRVFYVSKSEGNLFSIIASIIKNNDLPSGWLMLTPYLKFKQLLNPKKGVDFKERMIKYVLENSPNKRFILMGDDTQQDIVVYTKIAESYPNRILKIYIRKTLKNLTRNKKKQMNKLLSLPVSTLYFNDETDPKEEIIFIQNHQNL